MFKIGMNYFKSLTKRQWIIIVATVFFFLLSYFLFANKPVQKNVINLDTLMKQSTAPVTTGENIGMASLEKLLKQDTPVGTSTTKGDLTTEQKNSLFKLMSAPKSK